MKVEISRGGINVYTSMHLKSNMWYYIVLQYAEIDDESDLSLLKINSSVFDIKNTNIAELLHDMKNSYYTNSELYNDLFHQCESLITKLGEDMANLIYSFINIEDNKPHKSAK